MSCKRRPKDLQSTWLAIVMEQHGGWSIGILHSLYIFGLLRQTNAVRLVTPGDELYAGFCVIDSPELLGKFCALQDSIEWTQMLTRDMSTLPAINSYRAGVRLSSMYTLFRNQDMEQGLPNQSFKHHWLSSQRVSRRPSKTPSKSTSKTPS